jgi:hypothetical protein
MHRSLWLIGLVSLLVAPASDALAAPIAHPTGSRDIVVRVTSGGGFVAPSAILGALPAFTLYGDGSVVVPGPVTQMSPGPALAPLLRLRLREPRVQALLRRARAAGLLTRRSIDYGDMGSIGISDAPTTTLRLNVAGRRVVREAYALGISAGDGRLPAAQVRARNALRSFIDALPHGLAGSRYVPRSVLVYVQPYNRQGGPSAAIVDWPLSSDLASAGTAMSIGYRCIAVSGQPARTLLAALRTANDESRWKSGKAEYSLVARPLLPDERDCASLVP